MPRFERSGVVLVVVLLIALPTAIHGWPTSPHGNAFIGLVLAGGLSLLWWRSHPRVASVAALSLILVALALGGWYPDTGVALFSLAFAVLALGWSGRAAWLTALCGAAYLVPFSYLAGTDSWVATLMFTVPPYAAGTVLRLRRETADLLAVRLRELEDERELYADIALRHERARIASELHDIVGHAISVMVIQAAAGQRLVDADPVRAREALVAISESARQGTKDLERLIELLSGSGSGRDSHGSGGPDLSLVDEVVSRAGRSGLRVTCRFEGDRDRVSEPVAHLAFRVVQESLTNALRYAPGADVRIVISIDELQRGLAVLVENDRVPRNDAPLAGTGRGLIGLRERIQALGGQFTAGATSVGGWTVEARLPVR
jgi:signal transduction histidine kinase